MNYTPKTSVACGSVLFKDANVCLQFMVASRWPDGVIAPSVEARRSHFLANQRRWKCKTKHTGGNSAQGRDHLRGFALSASTNGFRPSGCSPTARTALAPTRSPAIWASLKRPHGSCSTAFARRCRTGIVLDKLAGDFEADESFIGGSARNMHKNKKGKITGTGGAGQGGRDGPARSQDDRRSALRTFRTSARNLQAKSASMSRAVLMFSPMHWRLPWASMPIMSTR